MSRMCLCTENQDAINPSKAPSSMRLKPSNAPIPTSRKLLL